MTPKEKAIELLEKMLNGFQFNIDEYTAKKNALIAVDEIISETGASYWYQVKKELESI